MKRLWIIASALLLALTFHFAYSAGAAEQREFEALCETPGVRCAVQVNPDYFGSHKYLVIPRYVTGEWREPDGRLQ